MNNSLILINPEQELIKLLISVLGSNFDHKEHKQEIVFPCPKCATGRFKLWIRLEPPFPAQCWVCGTTGSALRLIRDYGTPGQVQEFLHLFPNFNIKKDKKDVILKKLVLPQEFKFLGNSNSINARNAKNFMFKKWQAQNEDIFKFRIGYCESGYYAGRIIFPFFDILGELNYFTGRAFYDLEKKYQNPENPRNIIPNDYLTDWNSSVTLVEGPGCMLNAENSIPLLGSLLNEKQQLFIKILTTGCNVFLALDPDAREKSFKIGKKLLSYQCNRVWFVNIPKGYDVGKLGKTRFEEIKSQAQKLTSDLIFELQVKEGLNG